MVARSGPLFFHNHANFDGKRSGEHVPDLSGVDINVIGRSENISQRYLSILKNSVCFDRFGTLHGEYTYIHPHILLDRHGSGIIVNVDPNDFMACLWLNNLWESSECIQLVADVVSKWASYEHVANAAVLSEGYSWNYFHYTSQYIPKNRFFSGASSVVTPPTSIERQFQRDLIRIVMHERPILTAPCPVRLSDPVLAHTTAISENIHWLRGRCHRVRSGNKKYYIARSESGKRKSGGLSENRLLNDLLRDFGFERIEFGGGEMPINDQLSMIDAAGVIFSSHGAQLTNISYIDAPLTVIEALPPLSRHLNITAYMEIATALGFRYRGLVSDGYTQEGDLNIDLDILRQILGEVC